MIGIAMRDQLGSMIMSGCVSLTMLDFIHAEPYLHCSDRTKSQLAIISTVAITAFMLYVSQYRNMQAEFMPSYVMAFGMFTLMGLRYEVPIAYGKCQKVFSKATNYVVDLWNSNWSFMGRSVAIENQNNA